MQANALALDEKSIAFVGRHIESLAPNPGRNTLARNATDVSKTLYQKRCADCHGSDGQGDRSNRVPPLTSQQDWYLLAQIENFKTGKRSHFENDASLDLEEGPLRSIVAWICSLSVSSTE